MLCRRAAAGRRTHQLNEPVHTRRRIEPGYTESGISRAPWMILSISTRCVANL